ncbi:SDR family oxidoreductase [Aestuariispira insulae]|uniref:Nucleoside-diphosphate-sugar epimerase n=1 Tax=Aestuariispira insulae TaxID=1461337 RepID=A0A3D9HRB4_9PROT|nr:SDR family oxidoreductase [Aestuariispira insulae]RED51426.1 nucleoside-diphosphate-sugar epimerase [Aestuariispira insulae]
MSDGNKRLFCFGLGYSAMALARRLMAEGWAVAGTCRSETSAENCRAEGVEVYQFNGSKPLKNAAEILKGTTHLMSSVPPDGETADPVLEWHYNDIARLQGLEWVGYLCTTGVYGDRNGGWVDENSALEPTGPRGERRVTAEARWMDLWWEDGKAVSSFRLAGIYGPGRNALETVRKGKARRVNKPGQVFSRIHLDDITQVLYASMHHPNGGAAYNVCDDNPAPPEEVIAYACELLGVEKPPLVDFETADLSPMARSFYGDNKRVSNQRIKEELGVTLKWPDYRGGLKALL